MAWLVVEAAVALGAGINAASLLLIAFGLASLNALVSGALLLWRLGLEAQGRAGAPVPQVERLARRVVASSLGLLYLYVLANASFGLVVRAKPAPSPIGMVVAAAATVGMPWLARQKRRLAAQLGSGALRADAASSLTCGYLAGAVVLGLGLNAAFGWWWAEPAAGFVFLAWLGQAAGGAWDEAWEEGDPDDE